MERAGEVAKQIGGTHNRFASKNRFRTPAFRGCDGVRGLCQYLPGPEFFQAGGPRGQRASRRGLLGGGRFSMLLGRTKKKTVGIWQVGPSRRENTGQFQLILFWELPNMIQPPNSVVWG